MVASMTRVRPGLVKFGQRTLVRSSALQGEPVPEGAETLLLVPGDDAVGHGLGYALLPPLLHGTFNIFAGGVGAVNAFTVTAPTLRRRLSVPCVGLRPPFL